MSSGTQPDFGTTKDSITLDDYLAKYNSSPVEELNFLAPRKTITGKFVLDKKEDEAMNLGTKEQRTDGMKKQAQELIEQAYQRGYKAGVESRADGVGQACEEAKNDGITEGRNEAWDAARKLFLNEKNGGLKQEDFVSLFDGRRPVMVIAYTSATEVIEKLRTYDEQKKQEEDKIKVGDEVRWIKNSDCIGIVTYVDYQNNMIWIMGHDGRHFIGCSNEIEKYEKTGRHFSDMDELIKKMQEGDK